MRSPFAPGGTVGGRRSKSANCGRDPRFAYCQAMISSQEPSLGSGGFRPRQDATAAPPGAPGTLSISDRPAAAGSPRRWGLDAVIDLSRFVTVTPTSGRCARANILGVIHKARPKAATMPTRRAPRDAPQAEAAGLLWGAYHFGNRTNVGRPAGRRSFLSVSSRPGPRTLLALDLELNENNPSNSMTLDQAEAFVQAVAQATGRLPVVYVHPNLGQWRSPAPTPATASAPRSRRIFNSRTLRPVGRRLPRFARDFFLFRSPGRRAAGGSGSMPATRVRGRPAYGQTTIVRGVSHCDRKPVQRRRGRARSILERGQTEPAIPA